MKKMGRQAIKNLSMAVAVAIVMLIVLQVMYAAVITFLTIIKILFITALVVVGMFYLAKKFLFGES